MPDVLRDAFPASRQDRALHRVQHQERRDARQNQGVLRSRAVERLEQTRDVRERRPDHRDHPDRCGSGAWDGARREP
jgi:hypothetical protein